MGYRLIPSLVNGRFGDPALYVELQFGKRGLLLDIGDVSSFCPAKLRRVSDLFISHAHLDHFAGFDQLLRYRLERGRKLRVYGPAGIIDKVEHKLAAYSWNLEVPIEDALCIKVTEIEAPDTANCTSFDLKNRFRRGVLEPFPIADGRILNDHDIQVDCAVLDHRLPCLAFSLREQPALHILEEKLEAAKLPLGAWLFQFKDALRRKLPDETSIVIDEMHGTHPLGELRRALTEESAKRKICYVTDCQFNPQNVEAILRLTESADILFIEAKFACRDAEIAKSRYHLTTCQAGELAARARARSVEPFHFSERYEAREQEMLDEVQSTYEQTLKDLTVTNIHGNQEAK